MTSGATANSRWKCSIPSVNERSVSTFSRSPMWCPTHARGALGHAEGALQLGPAREQRPGRPRSGEREARGHVPARAPHGRRVRSVRQRDDAHDRVVGARLDRPVVDEEQVGERREPLERLRVSEADRLIGDVAARHHERQTDVGEQDLVQGRVREHHAEIGSARRHRGRHGSAAATGREHDRALGRGEQLARRPLQRHEPLGPRQVRRHERERLVLAMLGRPQPRDGRLVVGAAGEVVAADPLQGDDLPGQERERGAPHRVASALAADGHPAGVEQRDRGPAARTRVRLGVKAAV